MNRSSLYPRSFHSTQALRLLSPGNVAAGRHGLPLNTFCSNRKSMIVEKHWWEVITKPLRVILDNLPPQNTVCPQAHRVLLQYEATHILSSAPHRFGCLVFSNAWWCARSCSIVRSTYSKNSTKLVILSTIHARSLNFRKRGTILVWNAPPVPTKTFIHL